MMVGGDGGDRTLDLRIMNLLGNPKVFSKNICFSKYKSNNAVVGKKDDPSRDRN
jgi:hypothetical protein